MNFRSLIAALVHRARSLPIPVWTATGLALAALVAGGLWLWLQPGGQTETAGCAARLPAIAEAAADYNAYLREHCGPDMFGEEPAR